MLMAGLKDIKRGSHVWIIINRKTPNPVSISLLRIIFFLLSLALLRRAAALERVLELFSSGIVY